MKTKIFALTLGLASLLAPLHAEEGAIDCYDLSVSVTKAIAATPAEVLPIVQREVAQNPTCSCEIVKAAIVACEADRDLVGQIVSTAVEAAPDKMRIIAQCAIAVAPDALPEVQAVIARLDPQAGDGYVAAAKGGYSKGGYSKGGYSKGGYEKGGMAKGGGKEGPIVDVKPASPLDGPYLVPGLPFIHPPFRTPPSTCDVGNFPVGDPD